MKSLFKKGLIFPLILFAAVGCEGIFNREQASVSIRVNVKTADTKATSITTSGINAAGKSFGMIAVADTEWKDNVTNVTTAEGTYFTDEVEYNTSTGWEFANSHDWLNGVSLHFWSYFPYSVTGRTIDSPEAGKDFITFSYSPTIYTAGTDADNQVDLVFAGNKEITTFDDLGAVTDHESSNTAYTRDDNQLDIVFYHALSKINFVVSPDDETFDTSLKIKTIKISNVYNNGDCKFTLPSTFEWSNLTYPTYYSQDYGGTSGVSFVSCPSNWTSGTFGTSPNVYTKYTCDNAFFIIPQSVESSSIDVTFVDASSNEITKTVALDDIWRAGYYYSYKIKAKITSDIKLSLELLDWDLIEKSIDLEAGVATSSGGNLGLSPLASSGSHNAVADGGSVVGSFKLDSPVGATWFVSVTNPEAFSVSGANGSSNPAYGTIESAGQAQVFTVTPKSGVDRSKIQRTKVTISIQLADGTIVSIDTELGNSSSDGWSIILNPIK